ncbi:hypothetical protein C5167_020423 [Papaver somniferum]|uniref:DRBM domain-containing protein n=1 Tax=Papaver somniferum TaxID=3469 RepID=A0A4Y7IX02_PAPSO|nr:uncharacterized protein LOC113349709 [Papaver somniferum]RZC51999.1 hypothetical protein C5167_020423 [Papaver somniferum]
MSTSKEFQGVSSCYVFKSRLQEYAQKNKFLAPVYETLKEGPPHEPYFRSSVIVNDFKYDSLPGFCNRKAAEQSAAEVALVELAKLGNTDDSIRNPVHESGLCKNLLQEYAQKMNYAVPSYVCRMTETRGKGTSYTSTVDIGGIKYIGAAARTKKEAKLKAARTALLAIQSSTNGSHTNPSGDCQLTVLPPIKKAPEPAAAVDITKKNLKPRKNKFKKRWQKMKFLKKNGDQVTTDPTGEASGSTVIVNAGNCDEIHAQSSGVLDADMNDQSMQNVTSSDGSGIERFPTEEASGHTLNTSDIQTLGSAAEETMMDMEIRTAQDVGSANGSGLERLPAGEVCGMIVVRNTENTTEIQAHHGAAAAEAHLDMDIQCTQIGGLANESGLERMATGEASGNTENTNQIQAQGLGVAEAIVNPRFVQIGGSENIPESGGETLLAEAKLTYQEIKMEVQNDQGFSRNCESENGTGSGLQRLSAEAKQSFPETSSEVQNDQGFSQNGSGSGLQRLPDEEQKSLQEIIMEVQNDQGFFQNFELQNGSASGLELDEAQKSLQEINVEVENGQGFLQDFELQNGTASGLEGLPAEAQKSLQEIKMEVENDQGFLQNSELQNSGLEWFPAEAQKSLQEIKMEVENDQGFLQNSELQNATASGLERFLDEEKQSFQDAKIEIQDDQGFSP